MRIPYILIFEKSRSIKNNFSESKRKIIFLKNLTWFLKLD